MPPPDTALVRSGWLDQVWLGMSAHAVLQERAGARLPPPHGELIEFPAEWGARAGMYWDGMRLYAIGEAPARAAPARPVEPDVEALRAVLAEMLDAKMRGDAA